MRFTVAVIVTAAAWAAVHSNVRASREPEAQTTGSGIYIGAQAKRGDTIYAKRCESCHAKDLSGADQAPSLTGKDFDSEWNDMPLSDLFERIHLTMPGDAPGSLKPVEVADVIAFMLSKSGFPAGQTELPNDPAALKQLKYAAQGVVVSTKLIEPNPIGPRPPATAYGLHESVASQRIREPTRSTMNPIATRRAEDQTDAATVLGTHGHVRHYRGNISRYGDRSFEAHRARSDLGAGRSSPEARHRPGLGPRVGRRR